MDFFQSIKKPGPDTKFSCRLPFRPFLLRQRPSTPFSRPGPLCLLVFFPGTLRHPCFFLHSWPPPPPPVAFRSFSCCVSPNFPAQSHNIRLFPASASPITLLVALSLPRHNDAPRDGWSATFQLKPPPTHIFSHAAPCLSDTHLPAPL